MDQTILYTPFYFWSIVELIHFIWLFRKLVINRYSEKFDVINFHIAYPMLVYWKYLKKKVQKPVLISEHWSAYKNNFGIKKELPQIKNIFCQNLPLAAVSETLIKDIRSFSNCQFKSFVIPNIVDSKVFYPSKLNEKSSNNFLMCSFWKSPKRPFLVLKAFKKHLESNRDIQLSIIGSGPLIKSIEKWIIENQVQNNITLLGAKNSEEIGEIMRSSEAFLHPSAYETFSVVCAEALACGLPVIASNVGALPEVVSDKGLLVENNEESWYNAIKTFLEGKFKDSATRSNPYDKKTIGKKYFDTLKSVINESD
ncbi:glycosyltransferase family 4 protein [Hyphobacterium sp. CCMP332]|nr:glycosyltransferase family 4 protein [Hyphobacterium sp. CCMP332]